jgi:hypothetical protein
MNLKYGAQNSLHWVIGSLTNSNYKNVSECIKILLEHGCSPNMPNNALKTPFYMLLKKQPDLEDEDKLIDFVCEKYVIDFHTYRHHEIVKMMESQNPHIQIAKHSAEKVSFDFMVESLNNRNELEFEIYFKAFKEEAGEINK